jgi:hypothetical protein
MNWHHPAPFVFALIATTAACSASNKGNAFEATGTGGDSAGGSGSHSAAGPSGVGGDISVGQGVGGSTASGTSTCDHPADADGDGDGFTGEQGDCNDCDPNVNPGAIEVIVTEPNEDGTIPEPADEDCDGVVDNAPVACDGSLALDDADPFHGADAIELCQRTNPGQPEWGVLDAKYVRANGSATGATSQFGVLASFGPSVVPQAGGRLLGLSSGDARLPGQPNACNNYSCSMSGASSAPPGFPQDSMGCPGSTAIYDDIGLEVRVRTPKNATGYKFDFAFWSFEYPEWVCTSYNDQFIALVDPPPQGSINGNVSFDMNSNPVSVNIAFFQVCAGCPLGTAMLQGNGFDGSWNQDAGGTGWLETQVPVTGGDEITIRFAIWDTGDQAWDSTVVVDNFQWIANGGTVAVGTKPVDVPR